MVGRIETVPRYLENIINLHFSTGNLLNLDKIDTRFEYYIYSDLEEANSTFSCLFKNPKSQKQSSERRRQVS